MAAAPSRSRAGSSRVAPAQRRGNWAEQRALRLLRRSGWQLLSQQWRCRWGELDLVLAKPSRLLVVEVKGRRRCGPDGWGLASLDGPKRQRLRTSAALWLAAHPPYQHCSVELVLALVPLPPVRAPVRWIRWE